MTKISTHSDGDNVENRQQPRVRKQQKMSESNRNIKKKNA